MFDEAAMDALYRKRTRILRTLKNLRERIAAERAKFPDNVRGLQAYLEATLDLRLDRKEKLKEHKEISQFIAAQRALREDSFREKEEARRKKAAEDAAETLKVEGLLQAGMSPRAIWQQSGVSETKIYRIRQNLEKDNLLDGRVRQREQERRREKRLQLEAMLQAGKGPKEIAEATGYSRSYVFHVRHALEKDSRVRQREQERRRERRLKLEAMLQAGKAPKEITEATGYNRDHVKFVRRLLRNQKVLDAKKGGVKDEGV